MPAALRTLLAAAIACGLIALGAAPAGAASVALRGATLQVVAAPGEANRMTIAPDAAGVAVTDAVEPAAGPGCTLAAAGRVTCAAPSTAEVDLGDSDDTLTVTAALAVTVTDGEGDDAVTGGGRADLFMASPGADRYGGGGGRDVVSYAARVAPVTVLIGAAAADGGAGEGDDVRADVEGVIGGAGGDTIAGDASAEVLLGGPGDDTLDGAGGGDVLDGGDGFDTVDYSARTVRVAVDLDDRADDGAGERDNVRATVERVLGGAAGDLIAGAAGAQTLVGNGGDDDLRGGDAADTLAGGPGADLLRGGTGDDLLDGGTEDDSGWGEDGADRLLGGAGRDSLDGGEGADSVAGDAGDDVLTGGAADDVVTGDDGNDAVGGGAGDDRLDGGGGADDLSGDDGQDTADYSRRTAPVRVTIDDQAGDGEDAEADNVRVSVENVIGGAGADALTGSAAPNGLSGAAGGDVIDGGLGRDRLSGGAGDDRVIGGGDVDDADGGDGDDVIDARDGLSEPVRCGAGRDHADVDGGDRADGCETVKTATPQAARLPAPSTFDPKGPRLQLRGVRRRVGGGRFVPIPGFDGERIDRRLLADIAYLRQRFRVGIQAGLAMRGHEGDGEHPIGLALDIAPGRGGSWDDVDRLAKWAEPRQNRPRSPFRWVGYGGDAGHGRGDRLHLSWRHSRARRGHPARTVWTLDLRKVKRKPAAKR